MFSWANGEPWGFEAWASGEPITTPVDDGVYWGPGGDGWYSDNCAVARPFMCEVR